jgi:3'(2'), 5'-bisphosphate nucleotidase
MVDIKKVVDIAKDAGKVIMNTYNSDDFGVEVKEDDSPLTKADLASTEVIICGLQENFPEIPIMSEETEDAQYEERKKWSRFWCVDPLDGTKEFIKRNGEFTVNIALVENGAPVLGVIYAPATGEVYWSDGKSSWKEVGGKVSKIQVSKPKDTFIVVGSRSHQTPDLLEFIEQKKKEFNEVELVSRGSALKICMVADGTAHAYYRGGPTMEWDTAAGHAILRTAGAELTQIDGSKFEYNKKELTNPGFIVHAKI